MNLKNHTTFRPWQLTGDQGDAVTYAHGKTIKFNLKDIPAFTRNMCNFLVGVIVTVTGLTFKYEQTSGYTGQADWSDILRGLFESAEVQQTMFGTPVSANHYRGEFFGLFSFIANGMVQPVPEPPPVNYRSDAYTSGCSFFVPLSALLGMKGHHTAQPACCYDRAQLILRTASAGSLPGFTASAGTIKVSAVLNPEPELRLGPGTSFVRYTASASSAGTIVTVDALGNASTLEGVEPGAGLAFLAWMSELRGYGGAGACQGLEYLNVPFRDLQQTRHLDPLFIDYLNACEAGQAPWNKDLATASGSSLSGGGHHTGYLYESWNSMPNVSVGLQSNATFLPIITPHKFLEASKLQVVQGSQAVNLKCSTGFSGQHVFCALQYHSWTPAKQEEVLRKLVDSGTAQAVWGTNSVVPKIKVANKQPAGSLNPSKTRFFAMTWEPAEKVSTPPTT
jgi:hypothetical protein